MNMFKSGPKTPNACDGKPPTGARPEGGYGSAGAPGKAQKLSGKKGDGLRMKSAPMKPKGGYGPRGKPKTKAPKVTQRMGYYAKDGMPTPKSPIPSDQVAGRFNLPKGKFV
jgi:hypothetical protein